MFSCNDPDFHSVVSISLGELFENGLFDWEHDESLRWDSYSPEQYARVCSKILDRYYFRDIGIIPYGKWRKAYTRVMNEIMPKYKYLYKALEDGANILAERDVFHKGRDIFSDFPATMLGDNQDYASTGTDRESEEISIGDFIEQAKRVRNDYQDVDVLILDELEKLFSPLLTVSINGF